MDTLLARYFDGDLDDREARIFLERVESDAKLERELRAYERMLELGAALPTPRAPAGFTRRVMAGVSTSTRKESVRRLRRFPVLSWGSLSAVAAVIILAFVGGWMTSRSQMKMPGPVERLSYQPEAISDATPSMVAATASAGSQLRYVRLAYLPADPSVEKVSVAGSFNNWDPKSTPLQKQNGAWMTVLVLPPGSYEYMFVENDQNWITDPLAARKRDDGFGGMNAVLDVEL